LSTKEEKDQIRILTDKAKHELSVTEQTKAIDALASFGKNSVPSLKEIAEFPVSGQVREHAIQTLKKLRQKYPENDD